MMVLGMTLAVVETVARSAEEAVKAAKETAAAAVKDVVKKAQETARKTAEEVKKATVLVPPIKMTLEQALEFIDDDELVEVTPQSNSHRKNFWMAYWKR